MNTTTNTTTADEANAMFFTLYNACDKTAEGLKAMSEAVNQIDRTNWSHDAIVKINTLQSQLSKLIERVQVEERHGLR